MGSDNTKLPLALVWAYLSAEPSPVVSKATVYPLKTPGPVIWPLMEQSSVAPLFPGTAFVTNSWLMLTAQAGACAGGATVCQAL